MSNNVSIIEPTVGRVVHYWPDVETPGHIDNNMGMNCGGQPMPALVTYVFGPRMVNLAVFDHHGNRHARTSVRLQQPGDGSVPPEPGAFCSWMPYQIGQAANAAQAPVEDPVGGPIGGVGADVDPAQVHEVVEPAA